jgi:hypothetical protein
LNKIDVSSSVPPPDLPPPLVGGVRGGGGISAKLFLIFFTSSLISNPRFYEDKYRKRDNECRRIREYLILKHVLMYMGKRLIDFARGLLISNRFKDIMKELFVVREILGTE